MKLEVRVKGMIELLGIIGATILLTILLFVVGGGTNPTSFSGRHNKIRESIQWFVIVACLIPLIWVAYIGLISLGSFSDSDLPSGENCIPYGDCY